MRRYEREYGNAQRPIVRRICEHDSSASVPMILCVSGITYPPNQEEEGKMTPVKPYLELTDGWYRINAEVDECLARAIDKGKIRVGRKLAMSGSRVSRGQALLMIA
jgi:breast cancer 2 susceptibility protein